MKFKGFWKSLWELNMHSLHWLKEYWFAYTILMIVSLAVFCIPYACFEYLNSRDSKKNDDELEEFLK